MMFVWMLGVVSSQFYLLKSGLPQPGHIYLVVVLFLNLILGRSQYRHKFYSLAFKKNKYLSLFVLYTIILNSIYAIIYQDLNFLMASMFWIYGVLVFYGLLSAIYIYPNFKIIVYMCFLGLSIIILIYILGFGRYDFGSRFNALFNNPNQMAFWALCVAASYYLLIPKANRILDAISLLLITSIIFLSVSRGALIGLGFLCAGFIIKQRPDRFTAKHLGLTLIGVLIIGYGLYALVNDGLLDSALARYETTDFQRQADIRGYYRIFEYPEYLFFGSGQAFEQRFNTTAEIHSSWIGLLFYYGFVGTILFSWFLFNIMSKLRLYENLFLMAPFTFALTTYGFRTPIIWVLLAIASYVASNNHNKTKKINNSLPVRKEKKLELQYDSSV